MATLFTTIYASGCASACRHCWAEGHSYPAVDYDTIAEVSHQFHDEARARGWGFELTFMKALYSSGRDPSGSNASGLACMGPNRYTVPSFVLGMLLISLFSLTLRAQPGGRICRPTNPN